MPQREGSVCEVRDAGREARLIEGARSSDGTDRHDLRLTVRTMSIFPGQLGRKVERSDRLAIRSRMSAPKERAARCAAPSGAMESGAILRDLAALGNAPGGSRATRSAGRRMADPIAFPIECRGTVSVSDACRFEIMLGALGKNEMAAIRRPDGEKQKPDIVIEPISVRIPAAVVMTGFSRSRIYELIAAGEIQVAKDRRSTLIVVSSLRAAVQRRVVDRLSPNEA